MTDITLTPIQTGYNIGILNDNLDTIEAVINEEVIHSVGGNNTMNQDLDMDSNHILNVTVLDGDNTSVATVQYVLDTLGVVEGLPVLEANVDELLVDVAAAEVNITSLEANTRNETYTIFNGGPTTVNLTEEQGLAGFYRVANVDAGIRTVNLNVTADTPRVLVLHVTTPGGTTVFDDASWFSPVSIQTGTVIVTKSGLIVHNLEDTTAAIEVAKVQSFVVALGDETTALSVGDAKTTFRIPYDFQVTDVRASLTTTSSSGAVNVHIRVNGTDILDDPLQVGASYTTSLDSAAYSWLAGEPTLDEDDELKFDIDGAGTNAAGLKVTLIGYRL